MVASMFFLPFLHCKLITLKGLGLPKPAILERVTEVEKGLGIRVRGENARDRPGLGVAHPLCYCIPLI